MSQCFPFPYESVTGPINKLPNKTPSWNKEVADVHSAGVSTRYPFSSSVTNGFKMTLLDCKPLQDINRKYRGICCGAADLCKQRWDSQFEATNFRRQPIEKTVKIQKRNNYQQNNFDLFFIKMLSTVWTEKNLIFHQIENRHSSVYLYSKTFVILIKKQIKVILFIINSLLYFYSFLYRLSSWNLSLQTDSLNVSLNRARLGCCLRPQNKCPNYGMLQLKN